jgi:predicted MPP superfamily phosphohydrolase
LKSKKTVFYILLGLIIIVLAHFIIGEVYPKGASRYPFMLMLLAVDIYLWVSIRKKVAKLSRVMRLILTVLYWIPLLAFLSFTIVSFFYDYTIWPTSLITYVIGLVLAIYASKLLAVVFFLLYDMIRVVHFSIRFNNAKIKGKPFDQGKKAITRGKFLQDVGLAGGGILLGGFLIGMIKWANDFRVRQLLMQSGNLPDAFDGMRVVQISDIHLGSWASVEPMREAVAMINDLNPDVILFTGDLVNFSTAEAYRFKDILTELTARYGVLAILGNHDYGDYLTWPDEVAKQENMEAMYRFYDEIGWRLLRNENIILERGEGKLAILGVENWSSHRRFPKHGDLKKALKGTEDVPYKILMSHDPTHFEKQVAGKHPDIDLTLSGHTHGFQFGVEFKNFRWSLAQYMYKYWAGLYTVSASGKDQHLYVNRGLGMVGYPGRVGILPEITMITLERV